ncbi:pilus assembly protein [Motiliproteus sp. MSK22-1]|uniref:pilus assembly protein n=1 Tax=Motiliproteus sp. MSK22-1 TaxID=1897630 RepID=UPI0009754665|nr:PilC/PilY family type IV pilus protein [Motiliproteus sp. MSK22-1]OMH28401.1 hypothetical protein BGP75_21105 [Motiliproteus sp. MSK22-1]
MKLPLFSKVVSILGFAVIAISFSAFGAVSQVPLYLATTADPNVLFNMSVESPMGGAAYNDQPDTLAGGAVCNGRVNDGGTVGACYFKTETYLGYFDSNKCYAYTSNSPGYFYPTGVTNTDHECSGAYSGNFMNWASMTAIDMFIWTMTGGNRIVDTTSETIIQRARKQNNNGWYPHKLVKATQNVSPSTVTPWSDSAIYITNTSFGISFGTTIGGTEKGTFNLQVKVCDSSVGLESNCIEYTDGSTYYKPEGLIQDKSDSMRFAVTSFSKDGSQSRDGGVLRANMKYVGATEPDGNGGTRINPNGEVTTGGLLVNNPNPSDATASGVSNSGVINYLNKFSESGYKSYDPAAELFYESLRYFKNLGRTPEYADGLSVANMGGFPAITNWEDPIQYSCQKNFIVGINDANPWLDKRLPGTHFTTADFSGRTLTAADYGEPSNSDTSINVTSLTNEVGRLEGLNGTSQCIGCVDGNCNLSATNKTISSLGEVMGTCPYGPKENSYYIAGLAHYANTNDLRTESAMPGEQTVATFMIDTQEYNANPLTGQMNMLWLAGKYGGFIDSNGNDEPDLQSEWDEDADGEPDNYVLASRPDKLVTGLSEAFAEIEERSSTASAITTNSAQLSTDSNAYQAKFNSGNWSGHLYALPVSATATLGTATWDAAEELPAHGSRNIYSWNAASTAAFSFDTSNLATIQAVAPTLGTDEVNYIRGDQRKEQQNGGNFRNRPNETALDGSIYGNVLGDIVNSDPQYVSYPNFGYVGLGGTEGSDYAVFRTGASYLARKEMLYVGGNDGMLHAFDADTGVEVFAYIPRSITSNLEALTKPNYSHKYYVDGSPHVGDAYIDHDGDSDNEWRSILVSTTGAGGKGVFALDVTFPDSFSTTNVLWEIDDTTTGFSDLGYTLGQVTIVRLATGEWGAVFANGYDSSSGKAVIYIVDLEDGSLIAEFDTETTGNGMSTPFVADTDRDYIADTIYAGDLKGNLWKIDISSSANSNLWDFSFHDGPGANAAPEPLFIAKDSSGATQAISASPQVGWHSDNGMMIYFGTGKYYETNDNIVGTTPQIHSLYGVQDDGTTQVNSDRSELVGQAILSEVGAFGFQIRITEQNAQGSGKKGWYIDLKLSTETDGDGERVVNMPLLRGDRVFFTTLVPSADHCTAGGESWQMELNAITGGRLDSSPYDLNSDGVIDDGDMITITHADGTTEKVAYTGIRKDGLGITDNPASLEDGDKAWDIFSGSSGDTVALQRESSDPSGRQAWQELQN